MPKRAILSLVASCITMLLTRGAVLSGEAIRHHLCSQCYMFADTFSSNLFVTPLGSRVNLPYHFEHTPPPSPPPLPGPTCGGRKFYSKKGGIAETGGVRHMSSRDVRERAVWYWDYICYGGLELERSVPGERGEGCSHDDSGRLCHIPR